jgi:hypothetical protein
MIRANMGSFFNEKKFTDRNSKQKFIEMKFILTDM